MDVEQTDLKEPARNGYFESYNDFEVIDCHFIQNIWVVEIALYYIYNPVIHKYISSAFKVHRLMLEDEPRTLAYKTAIEACNVVKDKVVLGKFTSSFMYICRNFS